MLKLKLQYFCHLMRRTDSLEKTVMLGKIEGGKGEGDDRGWDGWMASQLARVCVCVCVCSVTQYCLILCDPMTCSMPGFPVHPCLLKFMSTELVMHPIISSSCLQPFPATGSFQMSQFSPSGGQSIRVAALASVVPMNIQDWFPLELTGLISLQSKGLSIVFSDTTVQKHQFFGPTLILIHAYWENPSFD